MTTRRPQIGRPHLARIIAVTAALAATGSVASLAHAQDPGVELLLQPKGKPVKKLTLTVPPGGTDAEDLIFIRQRGTTALEGVQLRSRGLTVSVTGGAGSADEITVPPAGQLAAVTLKVASPPSGTSTGSLFVVTKEGLAAKAATLTVERPKTDVVTIRGAGADGVTLTTERTDFTRQLTIESSSRDDERVTVAVDTLTDPLGSDLTLSAKVDGRDADASTPVTVPRLGSVPLVLSAQLETSGDYTGAITLTYNEAKTTVPLKITRTRVAPTITIGTVASAEASTVLFGQTDAALTLPIDETAGRTLALPPPAVDLQRARGNGQRGYPDATVTFPELRNGVLTVPADQPSTVRVELGDLDPGTYTATVRFHGGQQQVQATGTIYVRRSLVVALFFILAGIVLSEVIRHLRGRTRPRIQAQLALSRLDADLKRIADEGHATDAEAPAIASVRRELRGVLGTLLDDPTADVQARIAAIRDKQEILARWLPLRSAVREREPPPGVDALLEHAESYLHNQGVSKEEAAKALDDAAARLARLPPIVALIEATERAYGNWLAQPRPGGAPASAADVRQKLDEARSAIHGDDLDAAENAATAAWLAWLKAAAQELIDLTPEAQPAGFDPGEWSRLREIVQQHASAVLNAEDAQVALAEYKTGYSEYIAGLAADLKRRGDAAPALSADEKAALASEVERIIQAAKDRHLADAWRMYSDTKNSLDLRLRPPGGVRRGAPVSADTVPAGEPAEADVPVVRGAAVAQPPLLSVAILNRRVKRLDWAVTLLVGLAAAGLGVYLLWVPDGSWGELEDYLVAFLWGLGLHQAGNEVFGGIGALTDTIAGTPPRAA